MQKNKPKLRFPEFTDAWEQRRLGEFIKIRRGLTYSPSDIKEKGIRVLRSSNINEQFFELKDDDVFVNKKSVNIPLVIQNDILITAANGSSKLVGKHALIHNVQEDMVHGGFMLLITAKQPYFINALMSSSWYYKFINKNTTGGNGAIGNLKPSIFENELITICTNISEQQKIGQFFSRLDSLITLHQRKLENAKKLKKSLLQKMFPKNGKNFPEIRFPEFTDAWEQQELNKLVDIHDNLRIPITSSNRKKGKTPYYGANGIQDYVDNFTHDGEFVLVAEDGANDLNNYPIQYALGKIWVNNHAHVLSGKENILNTPFLNFRMSTINFSPYLVGGNRAKLNGNIMKKIPLYYPSLPEQQKIGQFFSRLDSLITLHQRKLDNMQKLKKSLLQQMFV